MSTISGASSSSLYSSYLTSNQTSASQLIQNLNTLGTALQSGDTSSAQNALATLQSTISSNPQSSTSQPFGSNTAANADYNNLVTAVNSGNTTGAQNALAKLQSDLKGGHAHGHHHHGGGAPTPPPTSSTSSTSSADSDGDNDGSSVLNVTV